MTFIKAPTDTSKLTEWIRAYLTPSKDKPTYRAHQFTINGVTYPFVRDFYFAAVPDPPADRRHDMYAGLYLPRPGDLIFFFQSDPQWDFQNVESRRGLRGIYRILSTPFRDTLPIQHPTTNYVMRGSCPACNTFHSTLAKKCPNCNRDYPSVIIPSRGPTKPYFELVLASRLEIEPLVIFERTASDERVYADMSDPGMIWIGRHDNQMGKGKGSSIRHLMPEEVVKLTRLMLAEPGQRITYPTKVNYPHQKLAMTNEDGTPATDLKIHFHSRTNQHELWYEDSLNFHISRVFDDIQSSFVQTLKAAINEPGWDNLEYVSSMFPWGYTAGTADFVLAFRDKNGRYKIVILELKKGLVTDDALLQVSLYVPWVVQVLTQFAEPTPKEISVFPIVIGLNLRGTIASPQAYQYTANFNSGVKVLTHVESPKFLRYETKNAYQQGDIYYAKDIDYLDESNRLRPIAWLPPRGVVGTQVEKNWLLDTSWREARRNIDLTP